MKFTKEHEWVERQGELAVEGITDFAQHSLGDVVSLELPKAGKAFKQGESLAIVDSMKASSDVYAAVSGEVAEVNEQLLQNPQWINESPYEKGWLVKLKPSDWNEADTLMDKEQYDEFVAKQEKH